MTDEHDFAIDDDDLIAATQVPTGSDKAEDAAAAEAETEVAVEAAPPPPTVVIQYRNRGLHMALLPPLLILVVALLIASYPRQSGFRPFSPASRPAATPNNEPAAPAGKGRTILVESSGTGATFDPIEVRAGSLGSPVPIAAPAADLEPGEVPLPPVAALDQPGNGLPSVPPVPPAAIAEETRVPDPADMPFRVIGEPVVANRNPAPDPDVPPPLVPKVTKEQVLQDIQNEARQKLAEQKGLENDVALSHSASSGRRSRRRSRRAPFHSELDRLIRELGDRAGPEIGAMCERYPEPLARDSNGPRRGR